MKPIQILFTGLLLASLLPGCEIHDDIDVDVKRKAIVYLRYNYNDGEHDTMDEVQTLRLFFFDLKTGRQYRDTTLTRDEFLTDTGAMQTYISNGEYGIVTLANVGHGSSGVGQTNIRDAAITFPDTGADRFSSTASRRRSKRATRCASTSTCSSPYTRSTSWSKGCRTSTTPKSSTSAWTIAPD